MKLRYTGLTASLFLLSALNVQAANLPIVELQTNLGTITLQLDYTHAPISSANFIKYVSNGFYKNVIFHRVIPKFMIQTGGVDKNTMQFKTPSYAPISLESTNITGLSNTKYTLAMARTSNVNSATSQFFINTVDNLFLNYQSSTQPQYAVFGKVIKGTAIVDTIGNSKTVGDVAFTSNNGLIFIDAVYASSAVDNTISKTRITLSGSGTVTSSPVGINCGTSCVLSKSASGTVSLKATPAVGFVFSGWRGDCSGTNASVSLDASKGNYNCTAVFVKTADAIKYWLNK